MPLSWSFTNKSQVALTNSIDKKRHINLLVISYLWNNCESGTEICQTDCIDTDAVHVDGSPRCFYDPE